MKKSRITSRFIFILKKAFIPFCSPNLSPDIKNILHSVKNITS